MTNKNTRRAFLASLMALVLCISSLLGTTYAWFTDSVTSANNIIVSGNLDVELEYWNGSKWVAMDENTNVFKENTLWEPGHTEVVYLKVSNLGSLALKYNLGVNIASETAGINAAGDVFFLSDYIEFGVIESETESFYADRDAARKAVTNAKIISNGYAKSSALEKTGDAEYVTLVVYMPETVGNEANFMTGTNVPVINLGISVFATQYTAEDDSFGTDYDELAPWVGEVDTDWYNDTDTEFTLTNAGELAGLAKLVNEGNSFKDKTVKLGADINLNNVNWTPIGKSGATFQGTFIGTGYTISNLRVVGEKHVGLFGATYVGAHIEGVTIVNAYVSGNDYVGAVLGGGYVAKNCIKNCTVENATIIATPYVKADVPGEYDGGAKAGVIAGQVYNGSMTGNTAKNSTVMAYRDLGGIAGMLAVDGSFAIDATGNTVENVTLSYVGVSGKYDKDTPNQNMAEVVGRPGSTVNFADNTITNVTVNEDNKDATMIFTLEELIAFAKDVNAGNTYAGKTVILGADIDLLNMEWTPIGTGDGFKGTFDGNGKTVSNLKITGYKSTVGFFANTYNGEIKNLTIENAVVSGRLNVGVVAGNPYTSKYSNITVKGHVEVNGMAYVGGVGGKNAYANWTDITVNVDDESYVKAVSTENGTAYRTYVGGVVGFNGEGEHTFKNITSNIDVIGDVCDIGGAFGIAHYGNNFENVTVSGNVTGTFFDPAYPEDADEIGGIAGVWHNENGTKVTFTDCEFTGTLTAADASVDVSNNTIVGKAYSATGTGELIITNTVVEEGITYKLDGVNGDKTLYLVPADYEGTEVIVPEGVTAIGNYAFAYNSNIDKIVLPSTVTTLNDRAFRDTSASTVVLNEGLENISYQAFRNALNVKSVVIPSTVKTISKEAFQNSGITELVIPEGVETIEYGGLRDMKELETVTIKADVDIPVYAFRACTNLKTVIIEGTDVTFGGGSKGMIFTNKENGDGSAITITVANEEIKARLMAADTAAKDYGGYTIICKQTAEAGGYYVDNEGNAFVYSDEALTNALADGKKIIVLSQDVKSEAGTKAPYGNKYGFKLDGGVLDGNNKELYVECYGDDYGVMTSGGTIKNLTMTEGCRAIMIMYATEDIILDNVKIGGDGVLYPINTGEHATVEGVDLIVTNSTLAGWTSYAGLASASFTNVKFEQGTYYDNIYGRVIKPYINTTFTDCSFVEHMNLDLSALENGQKIVFKNCTVNDQPVNASVFTIPTTDAQYDTELFTVDLPSWANSIEDCIDFN